METNLEKRKPISIGTCAWSFDDWRGVFYPETLPDHQRLAYYAHHLKAVEVDSTFYGPPSTKTAEHWLEATPEDFLFTCKLSREITHAQKLRDCDALLAEFLAGIEPLSPKLACILIQLPPYLKPARDELAFREFISALPMNHRFAVEFRDPHWNVPRIAHLLEAHRICWVWNDLTELDHRNEGAFTFLPRTTDFLYLRLMGDLNAKYGPQGEGIVYNRLQWPRKASLESWAVRAEQQMDAVSQALILINNHFEGYAPLSCRRMGAEFGVSIQLPELEKRRETDGDERQMELRL